MAKIDTIPGDPTEAAIAEQVQVQRAANAAEIAAAKAPVREDEQAAQAAALALDAFRTQHGRTMEARRAALLAPDLVLEMPGRLRREGMLDLMSEMGRLLANTEAIQRAQMRFEHLTLAEARMGWPAELQKRFRGLAESPRALEELWTRFEEAWAEFGHRLPRAAASAPAVAPDPTPSGPPQRPRVAKSGLSGDAA